MAEIKVEDKADESPAVEKMEELPIDESVKQAEDKLTSYLDELTAQICAYEDDIEMQEQILKAREQVKLAKAEIELSKAVNLSKQIKN